MSAVVRSGQCGKKRKNSGQKQKMVVRGRELQACPLGQKKTEKGYQRPVCGSEVLISISVNNTSLQSHHTWLLYLPQFPTQPLTAPVPRMLGR